METITAAAIQLNSQPDIAASMQAAESLVKEAADAGATFICLPENFAFFGDEKMKLKRSAEIAESVETLLPEWSSSLNVAILGGGYPASAGGGKIYNRSALFLPDGSIAARYDKVHLFDVEVSKDEIYRESDTVRPGKSEPVVFKSQNLPAIGFSICYDIRFPELYRKLTENGAEILTVPAAFTRPTGDAHWEVLLRARAIENTCYVIAPAQAGLHGESRCTWGHSIIIDPWGRVMAEANEKPGFITAEIRMDDLREVRRKLPSLQHRRV
ncbi:carbon-nitrogen hydrolase family protein [Rhodohalobacter sp. SW132]|uniref:carbon-nitrogen hydrolase family protein n=1 Tax=Rhodohalobacter sp. SW132 TaxID=2293433 RepID=UPI000E26837C|nr:carbon-nitrogen hydrolase family protein [Rhodohalobacter sp. SW132]REL37927.1 carbon-nitrogen hydrolase family protein [Rhodohalobacter sp. SW132]